MLFAHTPNPQCSAYGVFFFVLYRGSVFPVEKLKYLERSHGLACIPTVRGLRPFVVLTFELMY